MKLHIGVMACSVLILHGQAPAPAAAPKVTGAHLQVTPSKYLGGCAPAARGRVIGSITASGAGTVRYRFQIGGLSYAKGQEGTLVFPRAGTMSVAQDVTFQPVKEDGGAEGYLSAAMQDGEAVTSENASFTIGCRAMGAGTIALQADAANARQVALSWMGSAERECRLERKSGPDKWDLVAATTAGKAVDSKIDAFGTYTYRVTAGATISNMVTVGPPPGGFHLIAPRPEKHPDTAFGRFVSPVADANGDPALAFVYNDPNGDGRNDDAQMLFVSWDRAGYRWNDPVFVATVGNIDPRPPAPCVGVARDPQTGIYGITWVDPGNKTLHMAMSRDGGMSWNVAAAVTDAKPLAGPTLRFDAGKAYLTLQEAGRNALRYMTGRVDEDPASWKMTLAPLLAGHDSVTRASALALDERGAPAVAYWQKANGANTWSLVFWRPEGGAGPVKVADTGASNYPPDGVLLTFAGAKPRILLDSRLDRAQISSHYSVFSDDGGATWSKPAAVPDDGNEHIGGYMSFAVAKDGRAAMAGDVAGGNTDRMKCSWPKLSRSMDLVEWTTCAPQGAEYKDIRTWWGSVMFSQSGMLYLAFQNRQTSPQQGLPAGLLIWGGR